MMDERPASGAFWAGLMLVTLVFGVQAVYLAHLLVPSHDESSFLFGAYLSVRGDVGPFDDRYPGHRPPLPFYIFGATQVLFGRSLLAARYLGLAFGMGLIIATGLLARRLAGARAGLLAAAFLAAQGALVGYYVMGYYYALAPLIIVSGLAVLFASDRPVANVLGTTILGSLFFVRAHTWPVIPVMLAYALWRARSAGERGALLAMTLGPPALFFLWAQEHLKLLANVPLLQAVVRPLGYLPFMELDARPQQGVGHQLWMVVRLVRRYEFLALVTTAALGLAAWCGFRSRRFGPFFTNGRVNLVGGLFVYFLACLFAMFHGNVKWVGVYFSSAAPLLAVVLGHLWSKLLAEPVFGRRGRAILWGFVAAMIVLPVAVNRNPSVPTGEVRAANPMRAVHLAADHLARAVPRDARVFFFGQVDVYYLSGLPATWAQQIINYDTLAVRDDNNWATLRSGYYGMAQVERWLGVEADWAVISPEGLAVFAEGFHGPSDVNRPKVARIRAILREHFEKVDTVTEYPYYTYEVYRRVSRPAA